jgi:hypothetical protein
MENRGMTKQQKSSERRKFETHLKDLLWEDRLERDGDGYMEDYVDAMWMGWLAKCETTAPTVSEVKP